MSYKEVMNQIKLSDSATEALLKVPEAKPKIRHYAVRKAVLIAAVMLLALIATTGTVYAAVSGGLSEFVSQYVSTLKNGKVTDTASHTDKEGNTRQEIYYEYDSEMNHHSGVAFDLGEDGIYYVESDQLSGNEDENGEPEKYLVLKLGDGKYLIKGNHGTRIEIETD